MNLILKGGVVSRRISKQILSTELTIANKEKSPSPSFLYKVLLYYIYLWLSGFRSFRPWPWRKGLSKKLTGEEYNWTLALILFKEHYIIINIFTFSINFVCIYTAITLQFWNQFLCKHVESEPHILFKISYSGSWNFVLRLCYR